MDMILSWKMYLILPISILLITRCFFSLSLSLKAPKCACSHHYPQGDDFVFVNRLQGEETELNHCRSRWSQAVLGVSKVQTTTIQG